MVFFDFLNAVAWNTFEHMERSIEPNEKHSFCNAFNERKNGRKRLKRKEQIEKASQTVNDLDFRKLFR